MAGRTLFACIGNPERGDDGVGLYIARALSAIAGRMFDVESFIGEATNLIPVLDQYDQLIVIDAAQSGRPAGTVTQLDVSDSRLPRDYQSMSTHWFGLAETLELARVLGVLPALSTVIAFEGSRWETGSGISDPVRMAADRWLAKVQDSYLEEMPAVSARRF